MSTLPTTLETLKATPDALIELFILDATDIEGDIFHFYAGTDELNQPISFKGDSYLPLPIMAEGFVVTGKGELPRPRLKVANLNGGISALCIAYNDLLQAKVIRRRTYAKFLDGMPDATGEPQLPDEVFFVDRKVSENKEVVEFELSTPLDVDGISLPRRQILVNQCSFTYRGPDCGFTGDYLVADENNDAMSGTNRGEWSPIATYNVNDFVWRIVRGRRFYFLALANGITGPTTRPPRPGLWKLETCSLRITGCKLRFGQHAELPFGAFPGTRRTG
jgi:lambda family phage minor tail protein L